MSSVKEVAEAYGESLAKLTFNSKPIINNLTELANEYRSPKFAPVIVRTIEERLKIVNGDKKMPSLYLIDSIVKNHPNPYKELFQQNIVSVFSHVFSQVNVQTRALMYKLRTTWNDVFSQTTLRQLDLKIKGELDPKWPVVPEPRSSGKANIHINPAVFNRQRSDPIQDDAARLERELKEKQMELMRLQKQKLDMELAQAQEEIAKAAASNKKARETNVAVNKNQASSTSAQTKEDKQSSDSSSEKKRSSSSRDPRASKSSADRNSSSSRSTPTKSSSSSSSNAKSESKTKDSTPPPPPTIRGDYKKVSKSPIKSVKARVKSKSPELEPPPKIRKNNNSEESSSKKFESQRKSSSSSPSPPSTPANTSQTDSSGEKPAAKFRIPKKQQQPAAKKLQQQQQQPLGYEEEGPHVEFNKGKRLENVKTAGQKRKLSTAQGKKNLNLELFGEDPKKRPSKVRKREALPSPSLGWAEIKANQPDEFRTPMAAPHFDESTSSSSGERPQQPPPAFRNRGGLRGAGNNRNFRGMHTDDQRTGLNRLNQLPDFLTRNLNPELEMIARTVDPHTIETQIIPEIINQGKLKLEEEVLDQEGFRNILNQAKLMKEISMVRQMHMKEVNKENQRLPSPWERGPVPPRPFINQPPGANARMMPPILGGPQFMPMRPPMPGERPQLPVFANRDLPMANEEDLELIKHDPIKSIKIDDFPRDIRFYEETATCVMGNDDVHLLTFRPNPNKLKYRVFIDDNPDIVPPLEVDANEYTDFLLDGVTHKIKIGAPTREIWVDGQWYECYFEKSIRIRIGQNFHDLFLEGPAPSVKIGEKRSDLCAGYVNLVVDAAPSGRKVFLDAKPQLVEIDCKPHVLRFVEGLATLLINGHPFKTNFGGHPLTIYVNGRPHYLRLTALPKGVTVGRIRIWHMMDKDGKIPVANQLEPQPRSPPSSSGNNNVDENSQDARFDSEGQSSAFDRLMSFFPASHEQNKDADTMSESDYKIKTEEKDGDANAAPASAKTSPATVPNVHDLWTQLLGAGLVKTGDSSGGEQNNVVSSSTAGIPGLDSPKVGKTEMTVKSETPTNSEKEDTKKKGGHSPGLAKSMEIKPIVLKSHHSTLKTRQLGIINRLYDPTAMQCKNCGLRFTSKDMLAYSQHLDWHFRMKRKERDNAKRAQSRAWYFERIDWIISDEVEDEDKGDGTKTPDAPSSPSEVKTVVMSDNSEVAAAEGTCPVCKEEFEYFYKQDGTGDDDGHWHYSNAIRPEEEPEKIYHPQCFEDRKANESLLNEEDVSMEDTEDEASVVKSEPSQDEKVTEDVQVKKEDDANAEVQVESSNGVSEVPEIKQEPKEDESVPLDTATDAAAAVVKTEPIEVPISENTENQVSDAQATVKTETSEEVSDDKPVDTDTSETVEVKKEADKDEEIKEGEKPDKEEESPNLEADDHHGSSIPLMPKPAAGGIRITITSQVEKLERRESMISTSSQADSVEESEFDPDAVVQEKKESQEDLKPRLKGKKLTEFPMQSKDSELSGLCSIM